MRNISHQPAVRVGEEAQLGRLPPWHGGSLGRGLHAEPALVVGDLGDAGPRVVLADGAAWRRVGYGCLINFKSSPYPSKNVGDQIVEDPVFRHQHHGLGWFAIASLHFFILLCRNRQTTPLTLVHCESSIMGKMVGFTNIP